MTTGPFRFSRNPLYVALLLVVLAFSPALDSARLVLATALLFLLLDFGAADVPAASGVDWSPKRLILLG